MINIGYNGALLDYRRLLVAIALNTPIALLVFLRGTYQTCLSMLTCIYLFTVTVGYYVLALWLTVTIIFLLFLPIRKLAIGLTATAVSLFVCYVIIDSFVFSLTKMHIDPFWLKWIVSDLGAFGISAGTMRSVVLLILLVIGIEFILFRLAWKTKPRRMVSLLVISGLILSFVVSQATHAIAYEKNDARVTSLTPHLPTYYPITSHKRAARLGGISSIEEELPEGEPGNKHSGLNYPLNKIEYNRTDNAAMPNIVVLFFESWRFDMMNDSVTPNTYALSQKSLVCSQHYCSGNSTVAGLFGFFYGLHATYWTAVKANNSMIDNPVLIDILKENGYDFGIFARSNFKRHKIKDAIFRGIDIQESFAGVSKIEQDADMTDQLNDFLRAHNNNAPPFLAFAFYKSNHAPYSYPSTDTIFRPAGDQNLMTATEQTDPTFYLNDYKNATRYVDELIGRVLDQLDSLGLMSNTIIIISTDHGEQFNDDRSNYWGHGTNFTQWQTRIPLVFYAPDRAPRIIEQATSHVDIVPTILGEYFGVSNDTRDYSNGINLFTDSIPMRPLVVGSYVNHAYIIDDNVYEIYPLYTREYKLDNINAKASSPSHGMLSTLISEIGRFYEESGGDTNATMATAEGE